MVKLQAARGGGGVWEHAPLPEKTLKYRSQQIPFPAFSSIFLLQFSFHAFSRVSEMYFNSINFTFLLLLFPFQGRFFRELFWFYFTMKVAGGHVHNSHRKSPAPGP